MQDSDSIAYINQPDSENDSHNCEGANNEKNSNSSEKFVCECCKYSTIRQSQYNRHLLTSKHKKMEQRLKGGETTNKTYRCESCGKTYKHRQGLSFHRKTCTGKKDMKYSLEVQIELQRKEIEHLKAQIKLLKSALFSIDKNTQNSNKSSNKKIVGNTSCSHVKDKRYCKECGGSAICAHNRDKKYCRECNGSAICAHNKDKRYCRECNGSAICSHNKQKRYCRECGGSSLCKNEWCETSARNKYEGYCMPCFVNNPENRDKPAMRNYKTKEKAVVDSIRETFSDFTWIADKRVADGCSRRRPDLLLDMGSHIIIVEIDENRHSAYDCSCENKRLMELSKDLQHRPIVFIRFNPDEYSSQDGNVVESCWKLTKQGVLKIINQTEWDMRINKLKQQVQYWIDNPTNKMVEVVELFY